ncbi:MAG TPA: FG-GAP-like repeat-containing protein [Candidatus Sulfotelmatobacter sp.]
MLALWFSDVLCNLCGFFRGSLRSRTSHHSVCEGDSEAAEKAERHPAGFLAFLVLVLGAHLALAQGTLPVSFLARIDSPLPAQPADTIAVADLNSDGNLDVVVAGNANEIWVLFGNGKGTFQPAATYTISGASFYTLADFNGDGKPDILAVGGSTIYVLLNNGDGTFGAPVSTAISTSAPGVIAIGDFNGDGKADVSVPVAAPQNGYSAVSILLGNGDGTFQAPINSSDYVGTPNSVNSVQVADFNRDGKLDILWGGNLFLGNGNGTVQNALATSIAGSVEAVADINGDGIPDVVANSYQTHTFEASIFIGKGDGTFSAPVVALTVVEPADLLQVLPGDFNGDGKMDLLFSVRADIFPPTAYVILGNGDGTFQSPITLANILGVGNAIGDFNGDGIPDVVGTAVSNAYFNVLSVVSVALGQGNGNFSADTVLISCGPGLICFGKTVTVGDLNGDGYPDFLFLSLLDNGSGGVGAIVLLANPGGGYNALTGFNVNLDQGLYASAAFADFNKDGKLDAAVASASALGILLGNGDGTFQQQVTYGTTIPSFVAVGDFHGNGNIDVVTADTSGDTVSLFPGNGDGTFGFATSFTAGNSVAASLAAGDFNRDGKLDLALANGYVLLGNGNGTFGAPVSSYPPGGSIQTADFNHDGILDLALTTSTGVEVMLGHGDGAFGSPTDVSLGFAPSAITVSDFNLDGKQDIAVGTGTGALSDILILLGNGDGTFQLAPGYFLADTYVMGDNLAAVDVNGDGYPDIVTGSESLLLNRPGVAVASVLPKALNFGNEAVGQQETENITFFNFSQAKLTISTVVVGGPNASDFSVTNGCGSSVGPGTQCVIGVNFTPASAGARNATLTITANDAGSPHLVTLTGAGAGLGLVVPTGNSGSATVSAGQTANYVLGIGGEGFSGTATLSCTGAPTGAICSVPMSVNVSGTKATQFNASVSTTAPSMGALVPQRFGPSLSWWAVGIVGMLVLPLVSRNKGALRRLALSLPLGVTLAISSCGGGSGSTGGSGGGTPAGTSTVTITATSGTLQESVQLKLTVH